MARWWKREEVLKMPLLIDKITRYIENSEEKNRLFSG